MSHVCKQCGKGLTPPQVWKKQVFCCSICAGNSRIIKRAATFCGYCKKALTHKKGPVRVFCSKYCRYKAQQCAPADLLRICNQCGKEFKVHVSSSKKLTCSPECFGALISQRQLGTIQSKESKAKKSKSLREHNLRHPEKNAARAAAAAQGLRDFYADKNRSLMWRQNHSDYMKDLMASPEGERRKAGHRRALKKAHTALRADTDFVEIWTLTLARLRRENPFPDGGDYVYYMHKIGKLLLADVELRRCADTFMSVNLANFIAEEFPADA